jgi:hypothetical protein
MKLAPLLSVALSDSKLDVFSGTSGVTAIGQLARS